jgi:hypothetical protein
VAAKYPDDSIQDQCDAWWLEDSTRDVVRGRLLKTFVPFPEPKPFELVPVARPEPTEHKRALFNIQPFNLTGSTAPAVSALPVAGMPLRPAERYAVIRGKVRPVLVVGGVHARVAGQFLVGAPGWQTAPSLLVAPFYGADQDGTRGGWHPEFVRRIRRAKYPQFVWDMLPLTGPSESILRLDHAFSISAHPEAFVFTPHRLSEEAVALVESWVSWLVTGALDVDCDLDVFRKIFADG